MDDVAHTTAAIARGDRGALARLYEAKFDLLYAAARRAVGADEQDCLDVVQEATMRIIRSIRVFETESALDAWLRRVAANVAYDRLRRDARRARRERAVAREAQAPADAHTTGAERLARVRKELAAMDRAAADLLDLRFRAGMTLEAIGARLGLSAGATHRRISRALAEARARAKETDDG